MFGGVMMAAICDRYEVTKEAWLKPNALKVYQGLRLCVKAHGIPGFVARGVCAEDMKSIYICSSRDQVTHCVHGFWRYYHSPLCDETSREEIRGMVTAIADRMTRNVIPENDYGFLRADGTRDPREICRMWNVRPHEAARLPMIYAVAWDIGQRQEDYKQWRRYIKEAIAQSLDLSAMTDAEIMHWVPGYAVLQMQTSLEPLYALERDEAQRKEIARAMMETARFSENKTIFKLRKANPNARECGELGIAQLMCAELEFRQPEQNELSAFINQVNFAGSPGAAHCLFAAYWKARRRGYFQSQ